MTYGHSTRPIKNGQGLNALDPFPAFEIFGGRSADERGFSGLSALALSSNFIYQSLKLSPPLNI
jgi:hypothetical protein